MIPRYQLYGGQNRACRICQAASQIITGPQFGGLFHAEPEGIVVLPSRQASLAAALSQFHRRIQPTIQYLLIGLFP